MERINYLNFTLVGMAVARDLLGKDNSVVSVIGDGAMTAGQAYEALNNAGFLDTNLIVVLNDNRQVSLPTATLDGPATPVGALSRALSKLQASPKFRLLREAAKVNQSSLIVTLSKLLNLRDITEISCLSRALQSKSDHRHMKLQQNSMSMQGG